MYKTIEERFRKALRRHIHERYKADLPIVTERPPKLAMGESASPVCFELAKRLKKAPRAIAQEIANSLAAVEGVAKVEVAGGGYLNAYFDRGAFFLAACAEEGRTAKSAAADAPKTIVEHTAINPNKAAHIGHLRNAVLGDTFVRLLRHAGRRVEVQNYIDNTGVQVADVVLGFLHLEKKTPEQVRELTRGERFDYVCWDLYTRVTQWLAEDKARLEMRGRMLKEIEEGHGDAARMAEIVATAIVHCHLRTLDRLGIDYDLLSQESEILHLKFWDAAFEMLKKSGAIQFATEGKSAGCWVMELPKAGGEEQGEATAEEEPVEEAEAKIIVRSNGTVTYVGKDIAYHLWKFGLLDRDFHYRKFHRHPDGHEAWVTSMEASDAGTPQFGRAKEVFNVIDSRQAYPQEVVAAGLRALGHTEQAEHLKHFAYNVVALTPRCAMEMGYEIPAEEAKRAYVEVSGRKGQGVKADDLIDRLEESARAEVDARHAASPEEERAAIGHAIAVGALRYFLLRFTRSTVIAFDFKDALSFEGETGPYVQYAIVRVNGILRKGAEGATAAEDAKNLSRFAKGEIALGGLLDAPGGDDLWELILLAGSLDARVDAAVGAQEPAFVARYAFELAQAFNVFYHRHHILSEGEAEKRAVLLRITSLVRGTLVEALSLLGITAPEKM
ncbi:MAG TPA: arginine--tRNA ligase [Candidatus Acidoferrum sp.]|nr:arginine--tRNA ligase [Candidatus Acidoferrum sp.]